MSERPLRDAIAASVLRIVLVDDVRPAITDRIPFCNERCPHHDGKRCSVLGRRPGSICEPAIEQAGITWEVPS
jgi:hypothetical protein